MATVRDERKRSIVQGSGNVFADLGSADADERQTKVRLALTINDVLHRRRLSQGEAARSGINQPKISALSNYRLEGFSVERWIRFPTWLDQDVEIIIRNKPEIMAASRGLTVGLAAAGTACFSSAQCGTFTLLNCPRQPAVILESECY